MDTGLKYCVSLILQSQILCILDTTLKILGIVDTGHTYYVSWILDINIVYDDVSWIPDIHIVYHGSRHKYSASWIPDLKVVYHGYLF